jgi:protein gp37
MEVCAVAKDTLIEWTHHTFNPWTGCTKVSPGCRHCYANSINKRFGDDNWGPGKPRKLASERYWTEPLKWNRDAARRGVRERVFCASMADVFDPEAPAGARDRLWALIRATPNLDWQLLTKRPELIAGNLPSDWGTGYPNVWLGATVENQEYASIRVPILTRIPAVVRFLSVEPLLGPIDLLPLEGIDWVIGGGESAAAARPMLPDWLRVIRDRCVDADVRFFFKQWGTHGPDESGELVRLGKKLAGRELDGRTWDEFPTPRMAGPGRRGK